MRAHEDYYPLDRVPPFWEWLLRQAIAGHVKMPFEIHDEIAVSKGPLKDWINRPQVREAIVLDEEADPSVFNRVLETAYAPDLTDQELDEAGRDPFLVTYALMGRDRVVVTKEVSRPSKRRGRRKLPDACGIMNVRWITDFRFYAERDFRIDSVDSSTPIKEDDQSNLIAESKR